MSTRLSPDEHERAAWMTVILLLPVALLNYLDRQMLASMKYSVPPSSVYAFA